MHLHGLKLSNKSKTVTTKLSNTTKTHSIQLREAFQSKKPRNLGISPNRGGGRQKIKKSQVSVGKSSKLGGGPHISKKSQVSEGTKD